MRRAHSRWSFTFTRDGVRGEYAFSFITKQEALKEMKKLSIYYPQAYKNPRLIDLWKQYKK